MTKFDFKDRSVLVTGGTGSFGQAFIRKLLVDHNPRRIVIFSRDESKQADMEQELPASTYPALRYFIGDVRDVDRLEMAMHGIDTVVHAAALKHVPAAEYNPFECIRTNVHGAENVARAAMRAGVKKVIALSTDKAANPVNLYGASKLASDKIFVAANNLAGGNTQFAIVRYGNVVGSRGSVVPFFRKLIANGTDHLPITDPRMTRFWITLDQGVEFVLSCLPMMQGGEIFVPRIPSMKMVDLARAMAPNLPHRVVGTRPGEKIHEVLITEDDSRTTVELADRYVITPSVVRWRVNWPDPEGSKRVPEGFRYASDTNSEWIEPAEFLRLIEQPALA
jgi:UDP-N-acetylglucosamine 4,6-dehydratase/5-epimerase